MKPYTYIVIHRQSGYFYYGVRLANKLPAVEDLGKVYFTSSRTVKTIISAEGPDAFDWVVRKEFDTQNDAVLWEYKVIRRMLLNPKILNKAVSPKNVPGNWFTNGKQNILGKYCPSGFYPGRTYTETPKRKELYTKQQKNKWWNKNGISVFSEIPPSADWIPGRPKHHYINWNGKSLNGTKWWNNGEINFRGNAPPEGYTEGRLKFKRNKKSRQRTKEENAKHSDLMKTKRWWNNGTEVVFSSECPPGFSRGRLKFKRTS